MRRRQPVPRLWLMTDERQGESLWMGLERLPRGGGVVFRHYSLPRAQRKALFEKVRRIAHRRGLMLLVAGDRLGAWTWQADGRYGRTSRHGLQSAPVHDLREMRAAERTGAHVLFLSPVFATRSHPGARPLGPLAFARLTRQTRLPVIALGGMNPARAKRLKGTGLYGWAAIDAWS